MRATIDNYDILVGAVISTAAYQENTGKDIYISGWNNNYEEVYNNLHRER